MVDAKTSGVREVSCFFDDARITQEVLVAGYWFLVATYLFRNNRGGLILDIPG